MSDWHLDGSDLTAARDVLRVRAGDRKSMMTPAACLIILFAALTLAGYLLWIAGRLPRIRLLIAVLALVTLALAIVLHDLEVASVATRDRGTGDGAAPTKTDAGGTGS